MPISASDRGPSWYLHRAFAKELKHLTNGSIASWMPQDIACPWTSLRTRASQRAKRQACARDTLEIVEVVAQRSRPMPREPRAASSRSIVKRLSFYRRDNLKLQLGAPDFDAFIFSFDTTTHREDQNGNERCSTPGCLLCCSGQLPAYPPSVYTLLSVQTTVKSR